MIRQTLFACLCAAALAAGAVAQATDPPAPAPGQRTKTGVGGWTQAAAIDAGRFQLLGVTPEGVFYTDPTVRVNVGRPMAIDVRFERFEPKPGPNGGVVRSEKAVVEVDCPKNLARVGQVTGYSEHNLKGRGQEVARASWSVIGGDAEWTRVARGNLLFPGRVDMCRAAMAEREIARKAEARDRQCDARQRIDARRDGMPNRPNLPTNRY